MTSMNSLRCPRCRDEFYTAAEDRNANCPYCGFSFDISKQLLRKEARFDIKKECILSKGEQTIVGHTVDMSKCGVGVGVKISRAFPFEKDDAIHVVVKDHDVVVDGRVVWMKKYDSTTLRAGLKFC